MSGIFAVVYFLVTLFFSLALFVLWARIFLRYFKISSLQPVCQAVKTFTDPFVKPLENLISSKETAPKQYDWSCFALIVIVEIIKFILLSFLLYKAMMPLSYLILFVLTDLIVQPCNLLFYLILIRVVMSWINPKWHDPMSDVINTITDPLLKLGRSIIPDISGFDFSPYIIMVILKVITLFMSASMPLRLI